MPTTLVDRRPQLWQLWQLRRAEQERLAWLRIERATICACPQCGDADKVEEIDVRIRITQARITEAGDRICEGNTP